LQQLARRPTSHAPAPAPTVGAASIWRRIRRDVVLLGAGNVAIVAAQLGFRSLLVGSLVPTAYGRLSLVLSIYNTIWIIGASGLPNSVARYIAKVTPIGDAQIIRVAVRAAAWPTVIACVIMAIASGLILESPLACVLAAVGLASLVYSLLTMGIMRGRGRMGAAASIMPVAAAAEVAPLAILCAAGVGVTPLSAFGIFCFGNVAGLTAGAWLVLRTSPTRTAMPPRSKDVPSPRQLLGFSMWLCLTTLSLALLPLMLRAAATIDSYTLVAVVDVALVLFAFPQRLGAIIVMAVTPHVSRAIDRGGLVVSISRRESIAVTIPFVFAAAIVAWTPIVGWLFDSLGRPVYAKSAGYLALALLAGPARILYGMVEGVLIAHGEGRAMALTALSVSAVAAGLIYTATALGSSAVAFAIFALAFWAIYLLGLTRIDRLSASA
jgi:O-antigen/teichoic acid export membrane protein